MPMIATADFIINVALDVQGGANEVNPPRASMDVTAKFPGSFAKVHLAAVSQFP